MIRVLLLYGGRSAEHEISCLSARSVIEAVDRERYELVTVGITQEGRWVRTDGTIEVAAGRALPTVADVGPSVGLVATPDGARLVTVDGESATLGERIDVVFPLLHGPYGEDGTVQGLLETIGVPYVGADVTASSIGIDKAAMKASFAAAGLPQGPYLAVHRARWAADPAGVRAELAAAFPLPWFTKPVRQGSSIGISKVGDLDALAPAMEAAFAHDDVVVVEQGIEGARELEVGVLGDVEVAVTWPGEIVSSHDFYDFEAKYLAASELVIPAQVSDEVAAQIDALARRAYRAIAARGLARVDIFLTPDGAVLVNEINTIPGFTPTSMFPRLWAAEGLDYPALVDRLLGDAVATGARPGR